jgi:hypothetical protein
LFDKGVGIYAIAKALGLDPKTVGKYAHAATVEDVPSGDGHRDTPRLAVGSGLSEVMRPSAGRAVP